MLAAIALRALLGRPGRLRAAVPFTAAVLVSLLAVPGVWGAMRGLDSVRDGLELAPGINEREKCLLDGGHDDLIDVSRRLAEAMPEDSRFALVGHIERVCLQLTLLPRVMVARDAPRDFTVYADGDEDVQAREETGDPDVRSISEGVVLVRER